MRRLTSILAILAMLGGSLTLGATSGLAFTFDCPNTGSGPAPNLCEVYLDPDVHNGSLGTVLFHATTPGKRTISLNIPDGTHKIAVRSSAAASGGTNTSVITMTVSDAAICQPGWAPMGFQSWWSDTGQDPTFESRHNHIDGLCLPVNNLIVNGPQTFAMTVQLHNQPAGAVLTRWRITDCLSSCHDIFVKTTGLPQPDASGNLVWPTTIPVDLSKLATGRHEFRFAVYVKQPNGKVQLLSTRAQIPVRATSPAYRSLSSFPIMQGNGAWYEKDTNPGYVDARIRSTIPVH